MKADAVLTGSERRANSLIAQLQESALPPRFRTVIGRLRDEAVDPNGPPPALLLRKAVAELQREALSAQYQAFDERVELVRREIRTANTNAERELKELGEHELSIPMRESSTAIKELQARTAAMTKHHNELEHSVHRWFQNRERGRYVAETEAVSAGLQQQIEDAYRQHVRLEDECIRLSMDVRKTNELAIQNDERIDREINRFADRQPDRERRLREYDDARTQRMAGLDSCVQNIGAHLDGAVAKAKAEATALLLLPPSVSPTRGG